MTAAIEARELRFAYRPVRGEPAFSLALTSWRVEEDSALALVGPSGAGKTTLLKLLGGLLAPTSGELTVTGVALHRASASLRRRLRLERVGFVLPDHPLVSSLDALENVLLPLRFGRGRGVDAGARKKGRALLEELDLGHRVQARLETLSTGERQRVALARALIGDPRLVLADEPTAGLDDARAAAAASLLLRLRTERGFTLLAVSHDPRLLARFPRTERLHDLVEGAPGGAREEAA